MRKVIEKVVAKKLFQYCEEYFKLYPGQMEGQKENLIINTVATLIYIIQEKWKEKNVAAVFFMNVKKPFNHMSKGPFLTWMIKSKIYSYFVT